MTLSSRLKRLESTSEYIIREANFKFKNLGLLWSGGKDSTLMIALARNVLPEHLFKKMPIVFLNTGYAFQDTIDFIRKLHKEWELNLFYARELTDYKPEIDRFACCNRRKTDALRSALKTHKIDSVMVGIRRDEQAIRNKERFFSPRDTDGRWDIWHQPIEMQGWELFVEDVRQGEHMRVHPILEWTEVDVWDYMKEKDIPINPIYFSKDGKRYRSVGCEPCTEPIESNASTIDEILEELEKIGGSERDGRTQDKEAGMERLRALGYM